MALLSEVPICAVISLDKHLQDAGTHDVKFGCSCVSLRGRKGCGTPATPPDPASSGEQGVAGTQLQHTFPCAVQPRREGRGHAQGSLRPRATEFRTQTARSGKGEAPGLLKAAFAVSGKAESFFSGTLAQHAVQDHGQRELMDREPSESLREVGCPESSCSGTLAQHADKEYGHTELEERAGTHVVKAEGGQGSDALSMAIAGSDFNQFGQELSDAQVDFMDFPAAAEAALSGFCVMAPSDPAFGSFEFPTGEWPEGPVEFFGDGAALVAVLTEELSTGNVGCRVCGCKAHFVYCEGDLASAERTCFCDSCWLEWHLSHGSACEAVPLTVCEGEPAALGPPELLDEFLVASGTGMPAGDLGEIVLEDAIWAKLHAVLLDLRESVYKVMAESDTWRRRRLCLGSRRISLMPCRPRRRQFWLKSSWPCREGFRCWIPTCPDAVHLVLNVSVAAAQLAAFCLQSAR